MLDDDRGAKRRIETGVAIETYWAVKSGLQAGETIIALGVQKVTPGERVEPAFEPLATPDNP